MPHARIYSIIAKEPLGGFKAIAVKAEDGHRSPLFSEAGPTLHEALQRLFVRSAEAVEHHINTTGFDFVLAKDEDGDDSDFEAHPRNDDLSSDGSVSDDETISIASQARNGSGVPPARPRPSKHGKSEASGANKANVRRPRSCSPSSTRSRSRSRSSSLSSCASSRGHSRRRPIPGSGSEPEPPHVRWRSQTHGHVHPGYSLPIRPPHMHIAPWRSDPNLPRPPFAAHPPVFAPSVPPVSLGMTVSGNADVTPPPFPPPAPAAAPQNLTPPSSSSSPFSLFPPPPPPLASTTGAGPGQRFKAPDQAQVPRWGQDIRLLIRWCGRGDQREQHVLEHCPLTMRALQNAAVTYVRCNPDMFSCVSPSSHESSRHESRSGNRLHIPGMLRATIRRIVIGTGDERVEYDVTSYPGEDLQGLVDCVETGTEKKMGIPQVEVDVSERAVSTLGGLNLHLYALENGVSMKDVCKDSPTSGNKNGNGNVSGLAAELAALQRKTQRPNPADMRAQAARARVRAQIQAQRDGPGIAGSGIPPDVLAHIPPDVATAARSVVPPHLLAQAKSPGHVAVMTATFSQAATRRSLSPPRLPMVKKDGITCVPTPASGFGQRV